MYSGRTGESMDTIYWIEGEYIPEAMAEINRFMRDWRSDAVIDIDRRTIDILAASHRLLDAETPYLLLSGYRSAQTNAMLAEMARRNGLSGLSMGMSHDFEAAIAHGATHVRVGSAIFGARSYG